MTIEIETPFGKLRKVQPFESDDTPGRINRWLWECPVCHLSGALSDLQIAGGISIDCASHGLGCTYHETHDFRPSIVEAGHDPMHED